MTKNYIDMRIYVKDEDASNIEQIAEWIKNEISANVDYESVPVDDVTYEINKPMTNNQKELVAALAFIGIIILLFVIYTFSG